MPAGRPIIEVAGITKTYRMGEVDVHALNGVTLRIDAGEFVAIMGPSGSGKSTLMHVLGLLDAPDAGSYKLLGQEVSKLGEDDLAALRSSTVGFIFQQFNLLARTSALDNVALPLQYAAAPAPAGRAAQLLDEVGLGQRRHHKPSELSGGQQQRVAIARSMMNQPPILFADEPTGNLDSASERDIMALLKNLHARGVTIILVTHEEEIGAMAERVIRMRDGVIVADERRTQDVHASAATSVPTRDPHKSSPLKNVVGYLRQAWISLWANKVRAGLSMLGITIGVSAVIAMLALGRGAKASIEQQLSSLGSNLLMVMPGSRRSMGVASEAGAVTRFTMDDANDIAARVPNVLAVGPTVNGRAQVVAGAKNWNTQVTGTSPAYERIRSATPILGRFFTEAEMRQRARVAILGMTPVRQLYGSENPVGSFIKINRVPFQVIGVLPQKGSTGWRDQDDTIVIPVTTAMYRLLGKQYLDSIDVQMTSAQAMDGAEAEIKALIVRRQRLPPSQQESFDIRNMADIQAAVSASSRTMSMLLAAVAAISLLVGGIGIMNIMLVSVTERTREIGLRKALGARRMDILAQFLVEAATTSLLGGAIGIALGATITLTMATVAKWTVQLSMDSILIAVGFSAGVGIVFGLWPARKAAALNPIVALRYE